jgi:hypothetical protein
VQVVLLEVEVEEGVQLVLVLLELLQLDFLRELVLEHEDFFLR